MQIWIKCRYDNTYVYIGNQTVLIFFSKIPAKYFAEIVSILKAGLINRITAEFVIKELLEGNTKMPTEVRTDVANNFYIYLKCCTCR